MTARRGCVEIEGGAEYMNPGSHILGNMWLTIENIPSLLAALYPLESRGNTTTSREIEGATLRTLWPMHIVCELASLRHPGPSSPRVLLRQRAAIGKVGRSFRGDWPLQSVLVGHSSTKGLVFYERQVGVLLRTYWYTTRS